MEELMLVQAQFAPFRRADGVAVHAPSEAPEVAGQRGIRNGVERPPRFARNGVHKHRYRGNSRKRPPQILWRKETRPGSQVGSGEPRIRGGFLNATSFHMPTEVFERDQGIRDAAFRPIEKHTVIRRHQNVSGIKVDVAKGVWKAKTLKQ